MATAFFVWSSSPSSSCQVKPQEGLEDLALSMTNPLFEDLQQGQQQQQPLGGPQIQRPRSKKNGRSTGPKKPPQRGLGVAQLERLRMLERPRTNIPEMDQIHQIQHSQQQQLQYPFQLNFPAYERPGGVSLARFAGPVGYGSPWGEACFLQRHRMGAPGMFGPGGVSTVRSVYPEQHAVNGFRMAAGDGRLPVGSPFPELSSNQKLQCLSDNCELCIKKQCMLGENLEFMGSNSKSEEQRMSRYDFLQVDLKTVDAVEELNIAGFAQHWEKQKDMKEYEFFPLNSKRDDGDPAPGECAVDVSSSSPSPYPNFLDLSLKLST